jgi:hypothetical protein
MLLCSVFYLGTKEQMKQIREHDFMNFLLFRFLIILTIGILLLCISLYINFLFRKTNLYSKGKVKRIAFVEIIAIIVFAILFTSMWIINN